LYAAHLTDVGKGRDSRQREPAPRLNCRSVVAFSSRRRPWKQARAEDGCGFAAPWARGRPIRSSGRSIGARSVAPRTDEIVKDR
jgi:hypothetical protein